ncbi:hypothetical protein ACWEFJ_30335 [Actinosynnema sp. NPDC004786]
MVTTLPRPDAAGTPDVGRIAALLAELRAAGAAVEGEEWLAGGLAGDPDAPLTALTSSERPLSALDSAGVGFLTPMISFLEEPLDRLRGDPDAVSAGAAEFAAAGREATSVADDYRSTVGAETSGWSGRAASDYVKAGTELADGVLSIAETSLTSAKALIAAGEAVAKVVAAVTGHVAEAVAKITPVITEALAAAPATFGHSLAVAIPRCVEIAVDYAGRIAAKLAELLTSGENLIKLVEGALGVLKVVKEVVRFIGEQSRTGGSTGEPVDPATPEATDKAADLPATAQPTAAGRPATAGTAPARLGTGQPAAAQPERTPAQPSAAASTTPQPVAVHPTTPEEPA